MKSFDDFLSTLSQKDHEELLDASISSLATSDKKFSDQERRMAVLIAQSNATFIREILRRYHDWLTESMQ